MSNRIGATLTLPITIGWRRVPFGIGVPSVPNAQGDGSIVVGRSRLEPRQFTLSGSIYYPSRQAIRGATDELLHFLQHPPIEVFQWPGDERRLFAWPQGVPQDWLDLGAELVVDVPMLAPDPYWYGTEVIQTESDAGGWSIEVDGTAPTHPVVSIEITAGGQGLVLTHDLAGKVIELDGDFTAGDVVTVDAGRFRATLERDDETEPINDLLSDEFIAHGFDLVPGTNALEYDGPDAEVTLTYRPRWY